MMPKFKIEENDPTIMRIGKDVKVHREHKNFTQSQLAKKLTDKGVNRTNIAHLEQGLRMPPLNILEAICSTLEIPDRYWKPFTNEKTYNRIKFEYLLGELIGTPIVLNDTDETVIKTIEGQIEFLFHENLDSERTLANLNRIMIFYGIKQFEFKFFDAYLGAEAFQSLSFFEQKIEKYQTVAIRLFSSFKEAFEKLNDGKNFDILHEPLKVKKDEVYRKRTSWDSKIKKIPEEKLPYLGYIAANKIRAEREERNFLSKKLHEIADRLKNEKKFSIVSNYNKKTINRIDSLLRKFNSTIEHGLDSTLFSQDPYELEEEAKRIVFESDVDIQELEETQKIAYENLTNYLSADFMDVYVATSMREYPDFVSVNNFVTQLFEHTEIKPLQLRYFNPTQSWIEDRVAKGLVEAVMLKRASHCIYMAQKSDTFGKDSEASVSLGHGKPVIVYVPKLHIPDINIDSEEFGKKERNDLINLINKEDPEASSEIEDDADNESLHRILLEILLKKADDSILIDAVQKHWADYDLYEEAKNRIKDKNESHEFRTWLDKIVKKNEEESLSQVIKTHLINLLIPITIRFERRTKIFKEVHPLALQVIISSGVLNGIMVARSIDSCAYLMKGLIHNALNYQLKKDENNYKLVEETTNSTIRVISRHNLLANAFANFYRGG